MILVVLPLKSSPPCVSCLRKANWPHALAVPHQLLQISRSLEPSVAGQAHKFSNFSSFLDGAETGVQSRVTCLTRLLLSCLVFSWTSLFFSHVIYLESSLGISIPCALLTSGLNCHFPMFLVGLGTFVLDFGVCSMYARLCWTLVCSMYALCVLYVCSA